MGRYNTYTSKKRHKVYGKIILQPYITDQNVPNKFLYNVLKETVYMTEVSV